jgi:hypothetical protein
MNSWENFYQRLARETRERAAQATSPSARAAFEQAAVEWSELAKWAERQDKKTSGINLAVPHQSVSALDPFDLHADAVPDARPKAAARGQ